ncbi:MarR family transcriptional regulator [Crocinitomicaceae bacterium]|jgi:MarR family transcriptional regulator, 2-MHQ and catechol-resistance regulon repressor|nr:MarR family transcriptional regulator [Crocinitomicaceae bacterium]|tara:strand:+ start:86 stop:535 length:450 start_codon:yes stop_codon:yes gene_type:complete
MNIDDIVKTGFSSAQIRALLNVRITSNYIASEQNKFMVNFGLSMAQFNILRILRGAKEPLTINIIKERMIEKSPNTTRLMDKLMEKNYIERYGCKEDRRQSFVQITETGLALLKDIDNQGFDLFLSANGLTVEEANQLSDLLDKFRSSF